LDLPEVGGTLNQLAMAQEVIQNWLETFLKINPGCIKKFLPCCDKLEPNRASGGIRGAVYLAGRIRAKREDETSRCLHISISEPFSYDYFLQTLSGIAGAGESFPQSAYMRQVEYQTICSNYLQSEDCQLSLSRSAWFM
jgi:hypothetical protein